MRRSFVLAFVLVLSVAWASPAAAKCLPGEGCPTVKTVRAVITGPGIDPPIVVRGSAFWTLAQWSGISQAQRSFSQYVEPEFPGEQALGPSYRVRFVVRVQGGDRLVLVQRLYPYAPGDGPSGAPVAWTFTPEGERFIADYGAFVEEYPIGGGWWRSTYLFQTLVANGLPERPPDAAIRTMAESQARAIAQGESDDSGWWSGGSVAVGLVLLALMAAVIVAFKAKLVARPSGS